MNFWETIFLFFAFNAFLFALYFFVKKKGDRVANGFLGIYLVLFSINLIYNTMYWSGLMFKLESVHFYGVLVLIWMLYPPLVYLYARRVMTRQKISFKDSVHLIPFAVTVWAYFPFYTLEASEKLNALRQGLVANHIRFVQYITLAVILVMVGYTLFTYLSFRSHNVGLNKKRWFLWVIGSFSCYVLAMITYFVLTRMGLISTGHDYFITYTIVFFIGLLSYFGIMQPEVFEGRSMDSILPFKKYRTTGLSESHSKELKLQLLDYFKEARPYLKNDLRLSDVAVHLNLSRHHTSQVINEHFDANFFDFVNRYRIEEAKELLLQENQLNITDIIYSSGFNNRVSFYNAFKKFTGMTPGAFKAENNAPS